MKVLLCGLLFFLFFFSHLTFARAEGFALYEFSARSIALGGAVMARKPDASVIASNPAALLRLGGVHLMSGVSAVRPRGKMTGYTQDQQRFSTSLKSSTWFIPHFYYAHKLTDRVAVGIGEFSRFGLGFEYPHGWPGRFNIYEVSLQTGSLNPNIAVALTDKLSVGLGVEILHSVFDLKKRSKVQAGPARLEVDCNIQNADSVAYGYNLAAHYQFNEQWALGLAYRSHVTIKNEGDMQYTLLANSGGEVGENIYRSVFKDGKAWGRVRLPESLAFGLAYEPVPELSMEIGGIWTRWSRFDALDIHLPDMPIENQRLAPNSKDWRNVWRLNVGIEYSPLDWLSLRAGYVYDQSPMQVKYEDYLVPTARRQIYSAGLGFRYDKWSLDLAYAFIDAKGRTYRKADPDGTCILQSKAKSTFTDIVSASLAYHF